MAETPSSSGSSSSYPGSCSGVAILTSGGDAQGMNAAVRAVIRYLDYKSVPVFAVMEGYEGLCKGGDMIREMEWQDVLGILSKGGTMIGTARCAAFKTREGRKKAAMNLVLRNINNLIIIGGDGSLTGASIFKTEWPEFISELLKEKLIYPKNAKTCSRLNIVGLVGSIDNDLCGTDMTIGTDSALHRIVDAVDCLATTASSHMRTFIVEVMGRHCGYLAIMSALATPCDWVFIPEAPPEENWESIICERMEKCAKGSKRFGLIIIAEGAEDRNGKPIKADYVKKVLTDNGMDVRITVLGHVQRGGQPTAFDRTLGSRLGCEAAKVICEGLESNTEVEPCIVSLKSNEIVRLPLMEAISRTQSIKHYVSNHDFVKAQEMRGPSFNKKVEISKMLSVKRYKTPCEDAKPLNIALACIGAPAPGVNSGIRALVKIAAYHGNKVTFYHEGVDGILLNNHEVIQPHECELWAMMGGCEIGTSRTSVTESNVQQVMESFDKIKPDCLVLFGGFEAVTTCLTLSKYVKFPVYLIPATISNNVPGSDFSIGCDTALNAIVRSVDAIKQSAAATRKRVFVIDVMGGNCGYLAVLSGLASGADAVYIPETPVNIDELQCDASRVMDKIAQGVFRGIIIRNENSSMQYKNDFVSAIYAEEGKDKFVTRSSVLGHIQQGYSPSPFDRVVATQFVGKVYRDLIKRTTKPSFTADDVVVIGIRGNTSLFTPVQNLEMNLKKRVPTSNWWLSLKPLIQILSLPPTMKSQKLSDTRDCGHCVSDVASSAYVKSPASNYDENEKNSSD